MDRKRKSKNIIRNSIFVVNKLYLFVIFIGIALVDDALALFSLAIYFVIYLKNIFSARLPIEPKGEFQYITRVYREVEDIQLKMDIWYPNEERGDYPLILFAHGGGWVSGFRNQPNNMSWCKYLASKGFAVASIDYRFGIKNDMGDILSDYDNALRYLRCEGKELKIDTENIILMGLSAGGHLGLLYSSYYSYMEDELRLMGVRGVVAYYAPSNLEDLLSKETKSLFARYATMATLKGKPEDRENIYREYSPIHWVSKKMPPILLVHGKEDKTVPFSSTVKLGRELKRQGITYEILAHPHGDHSFELNSKDFHTIRILNSTINWMRGRLT